MMGALDVSSIIQKKNKNIIPKVEVICNIPYIYFKALKHIPIGTQLLYDYGDRKTDSFFCPQYEQSVLPQL